MPDGDLQLCPLGGVERRRGSARPWWRSAPARTTASSINVVSDRDVMVDAGTGVDVAGLLETGIPVTTDMSGGALVDPDGNLVGILTRAATREPRRPRGPDRRPCATSATSSTAAARSPTGGWAWCATRTPPRAEPQGGAHVQMVFAGQPRRRRPG